MLYINPKLIAVCDMCVQTGVAWDGCNSKFTLVFTVAQKIMEEKILQTNGKTTHRQYTIHVLQDFILHFQFSDTILFHIPMKLAINDKY